MLTYDELVERYEMIAEFQRKYRKELIAYGAELGAYMGLYEAEDYEKFINQLSDEEYKATGLAGVCSERTIDAVRSILNGEITFDEYLEAEKKVLMG